jgi:hypothetical protein
MNSPMYRSRSPVVEYDFFLTYSFLLVGIYFFYTFYKKIAKNQFNTLEDYNFETNSDVRNISLSLNNKMKEYETYTENNISRVGTNAPFIIRLKGRNFKNIKSNNQYDISMHKIGQELMKEFHAHTAMVFDDEIVLIFSSSLHHQFNGRCIKLQSIISSYASSSLTFKTNELCSFHSSIVDFNENITDLINYIKWRNHIAMSIKKVPIYIKKQLLDDEYKHVKFMLKTIKVNEEYMELFTDPIFDRTSYNIKFKKIYEMSDLI